MFLRVFGVLGRPAVALPAVAVVLLAAAAAFYFSPRPVAYFSYAGRGIALDHEGKFRTVVEGRKLYSGDTIFLPAATSAAIQLAGEQTEFYLEPETQVQLLRVAGSKVVKVAAGTLKAKVAPQPKNQPLKIGTPHAALTILGTRFNLHVTTNASLVEVIEGSVAINEPGKPPTTVLPARYAAVGPRGPMQSNWVFAIKREVWVGGTAPLVTDVPPVRAALLFEDYMYRAQTFTWEYPFLSDKSKRYRERLAGYFMPPETGDYTFWMMSQTASELWFSAAGFDTNKALIASTPAPPPGAPLRPTWNWRLMPGESPSSRTTLPYNRFPSQKSVPQRLTQGKLYYIEALHEVAPGDTMMIVWSLPGKGTPEDAIPGENLIPYLRQR